MGASNSSEDEKKNQNLNQSAKADAKENPRENNSFKEIKTGGRDQVRKISENNRNIVVTYKNKNCTQDYYNKLSITQNNISSIKQKKQKDNTNNINNKMNDEENKFEDKSEDNVLEILSYSEESQNESLDVTKEIKEANITNIIFSLVFPDLKMINITEVRANEKSLDCAQQFQYKNEIINIYHIIIDEQKKSQRFKTEEMELCFIMKNSFQCTYIYICSINFIHFKNNFYYNLNWRKKEKYNLNSQLDIDISFKPSHLVHYYYSYLKKKDEYLDVIKDLLNEQIDIISYNQKYYFNEYLSILIKSIQIKDSKAFIKCLNLFNNQEKIKYEKIDKNIISKTDIQNYLLNEEEIKELMKGFSIEKNNIFEKIKINVILRNFKAFDKIYDNLEDKNLINNIFDVIKMDTKFNQGLIIDNEIFYKLIDKANDKDQIKILIYNKCNYLIDFVIVITSKYYTISKLFSKNSFKVSDYIDLKILNNDLEEFSNFLKYYSNILKLEKESGNSFLDFNGVLLFYIENSKITHPKYFIKLLDLINEYHKSTFILKETKLSLYNIIHNCFVDSAMKGLINSYGILVILSEKDQYYCNIEFNSKENRPLEIFNNINIEEENNHFFEEFQRRKIWESFNLFKEKFIFYFLNQITSIENFEIIFRLFPKEIIISFCDKNSILLAEKFKELLKTKENTYNSFRRDYIDLLDILTKSNSKCSEFLHFVEITIENKIIYQIYLDIIHSKIKLDLNEEACDCIVSYLFRKNDNNVNFSFSLLMFFLEKTNQNEIYIKSLINNLSEYYLRPENFLNEENSKNFKIFKLLYQKNYFNIDLKWFISSKYYKETIKTIDYLYELLNKLDFDYSRLYFLFNHYKDNLKENIICLCLGKLDRANNLYEKLINIKAEIFEKKNDLYEIINYFKLYFPNSKIKEIQQCNEILNKMNVLKLYRLKDEKYNIFKFKEDAYKFNQLSNSSFFMNIYRENIKKYQDPNSIDKENIILENSKKEYNKLKDLFNNDKKLVKLNLIDIFYEELRSKEDRAFIIKREINYLKNYFNLKDYPTNDLEQFIIIYLSKETIKKLILGVQTFIKIFNLTKTDFSIQISNCLKEIDNKNLSFEMNNLLSKFIRDNLNLKYEYEKDEQSDIFSDCIEMLPGREGAISFAQGKEEWEIRNLNEFIGMEENPLLQTDDILAFTKVSLFINSIYDKIQNNNSDEYIYEYFKKKLNNDNILLKSFKDYLNKYGLIKDLYNEYLNKPEVSKIKILSIIQNSEIKISNNYEGESKVDFLCKYKSSINNEEIEITFDELNELRDRALISNPTENLSNDLKNDFNSNLINEEQKKRLIENEKFLAFVGNIKTIKKNLEELNDQGYPNNINIIIQIRDGDISSKWIDLDEISLSIEELIEKLQKLFNEQRDCLLKMYEEKVWMRFFYGKQFYLLSKYIDYLLYPNDEYKAFHLFNKKKYIL